MVKMIDLLSTLLLLLLFSLLLLFILLLILGYLPGRQCFLPVAHNILVDEWVRNVMCSFT